MHIKRYVFLSEILKNLLSVLFRMPGFSGRYERLLTICLLSATIQI